MTRRWLAALCLLMAGTAAAQAAPVAYVLDQRYATIEFTTTGLFGTQGYFRKFSGSLKLDFQTPENSVVDVTLDDQAITLSWPPGMQMLESPDYFDSAQFPQIRFHSVSIKAGSTPGQYVMLGELTIRGVTKPQMMLATLVSGAPGSAKAGTADFVVTGTLQRSDFGMTADREAVNDAVGLKIHARVMLAK